MKSDFAGRTNVPSRSSSETHVPSMNVPPATTLDELDALLDMTQRIVADSELRSHWLADINDKLIDARAIVVRMRGGA